MRASSRGNPRTCCSIAPVATSQRYRGSQEAWGFWPLPEVLPEKVVVTTLETEDRYFYEHGGVHLPSIVRALWQNVRNRRVISGASTIPMQVARLQHPKSRTLWGKAREAVEADAAGAQPRP